MAIAELSMGELQLRKEEQTRKLIKARRELMLQCQMKLADNEAIDEAAARLVGLVDSVKAIRNEMERRG